MGSYSAYAAKTNTAAGPTTGAPMINMMATAVSQIAIWEIDTGSSVSADAACEYGVYRASARGTATASFTATPLDQNNTMTALTTIDTTWNSAPTTTAASQVLSWGQHQRGTYRFVAYDYSKYLRSQAGTGKGLALMSIVAASPWTAVFTICYDE